MSTRGANDEQPTDPNPRTAPGRAQPPVERLLFIADAAVADVDELPPAVRAVIDEAAEVYVVRPPSPAGLPGSPTTSIVSACRRRASRHGAGTHALDRRQRQRLAGRGSVLTVIADAVAEFKPDHVLIALRSSEHANWQERRLIEHIEERFGLPVTTYAVDRTGTRRPPTVRCSSATTDPRTPHAIERAGDCSRVGTRSW